MPLSSDRFVASDYTTTKVLGTVISFLGRFVVGASFFVLFAQPNLGGLTILISGVSGGLGLVVVGQLVKMAADSANGIATLVKIELHRVEKEQLKVAEHQSVRTSVSITANESKSLFSRAEAEAPLMAKYGIIRDGDVFVFQKNRYAEFSDALFAAKRAS
jgi:glyoxylate carboligase